VSVLSSQSIWARRAMLAPMKLKYKLNGLSGGLGSASYDVAIAETIIMWPGRFKLASTIEKFYMPHDLCATVHDKSTWARRGLCCQTTFIDPGWEGYLTLELTLHSFRFFRILAGTPIAQIVFHMLDKYTNLPYSGKYQHQEQGAQSAR